MSSTMPDSHQRSRPFDVLFSTADSESPGCGYPSCSREVSLISPNRNDPNGFYAFLGVSPSCTSRELRSAIRKKYRQYHPDGWEPNEEFFFRVKWLSKILLDPRTRKFYDNTPPGYTFREPGQDDENIIHEIPIEDETEENLYFDYFAINPEPLDELLATLWYDSLVSVAPIFRYMRPIKVVLTNDSEPRWLNAAGMFIIPRWWDPSKATAFALFSVHLKKY